MVKTLLPERKMTDTALKTFIERVNELIESKLILTKKAVTGLLKFVAANEAMLSAIRDSLAEITYAKEFSRAKTTITRPDGTVLDKLKTPPTDARLFAFVVCLLTEFDTDKRDLIDFLRQFFAGEDSNAAYAEFADQFLRPFKRAGERLLSKVYSADSFDEPAPDAESYFNPERVYINQQALVEMLEITATVAEKAQNEVFFSQQEKADAKEITVAMKNALLSKNPKLIKVIWIGFYHTLTQLKNTYLQLKKLSSLLMENNLI